MISAYQAIPSDPVLTGIALEYLQNRGKYFGKSVFFPYVSSEKASGVYYEFDAYNTLTARKAEKGRQGQLTRIDLRATKQSFMARQWGFATTILAEDRRDVYPSADLDTRAVRMLEEQVLLSLEVEAERIVDVNSTSPTQAATAAWTAATADPKKDVSLAAEKVLKRIGVLPNAFAIVGAEWSTLTASQATAGSAGALYHEAVKYVAQATGRTMQDPTLVASYFNVEVAVPLLAIRNATTDLPESTVASGGLAADGGYVWDEPDTAYVFITDPNPDTATVMYGGAMGPVDIASGSYAESPRVDVVETWSEVELKEVAAGALCKITGI